MRWLIPQLIDSGVNVIEAWNEANVIHEWNDSMEALREMQQVVYETAKNISSEVIVLSPSSTSWDIDYFNSLIKYDVLKYCDGIAAHGYTYDAPNMYRYFFEMEKISISAKLPIYLTEVGFRIPAFSSFACSTYFFLISLFSYFSKFFKCCLWFRFQKAEPESLGFYDQDSSSGYSMIGNNDIYARGSFAAYRLVSALLPLLTPIRSNTNDSITHFIARSEYGQVDVVHDENGLFEKLPCVETHKVIDIFGNTVSRESMKKHKLIISLPSKMLPELLC